MMKRAKKNPSDGGDPGTHSEPETVSGLRDLDRKLEPGLNSLKLMGLLLAFVMAVSVLFSLSVVLRDPPSDCAVEHEEARVFELKTQKVSGKDLSETIRVPKENQLNDLIVPGFDERSCLSRYQSSLYRKELPFKPSSYLISRLRTYEALHRRCGPHTESYNKTLEQISSRHRPAESSDCSYVVWIAFSGLENKILTLASAFLYALLTNRILLVDPGIDMVDLFCEPFPNTSWFLPSDFPLNSQFDSFDEKSPHYYGNMLKRNVIDASSFVYFHMVHDYDDHAKLFFCEENQASLKKIPWLAMKTDYYFVPSLLFIPPFEQELKNLFSDRKPVFHFLVRYLFHPTNSVWGRITRYYRAYLAKADEKIGIEIRVSDTQAGPFQYILDQVLSCTTRQKLLPQVDREKPISAIQGPNRSSKAVLIISLSSWYFEKVRDMYLENPTTTGEIIGVYQPSNEKYQPIEEIMHDRKALAEMYLLSLSDVLITSSCSTFGYIAQGLGGLKPWILHKSKNRTVPDPPCGRVMPMKLCLSMTADL